MHDATEAYCGDVIKPLKVLLPRYIEIENSIEDAIAEKFGLDFSSPDIKRIDREMIIAERKLLYTEDFEVWGGEKDVRHHPNMRIIGYTPREAEQQFTDAAISLGINVRI